MGTFTQEEPNPDEPIIPVRAKARVKIKSDGTVDKHKIRICLRGDKQAELVDWDTWCPIAGFRELKLFLSFAARFLCRIIQLDFHRSLSSSTSKKQSIYHITKRISRPS